MRIVDDIMHIDGLRMEITPPLVSTYSRDKFKHIYRSSVKYPMECKRVNHLRIGNVVRSFPVCNSKNYIIRLGELNKSKTVQNEIKSSGELMTEFHNSKFLQDVLDCISDLYMSNEFYEVNNFTDLVPRGLKIINPFSRLKINISWYLEDLPENSSDTFNLSIFNI